ncbi:MAG TPA: glycosyltransferase family 4 protein [Solirubrobacteraceae bacterium]|jgi:glycosyltransferase involved in cell wall biosynthesis|nr:glycosyltransferase family 4 protein [Solirubrobacteraceae bacterium]
MSSRSLRIAWLGAGPLQEESGGVPGVATELLYGLSELGHRIDCFLPGSERPVPKRLAKLQRLTFVWGTSQWRWNRWYSRTPVARFVSGLLARSVASLRVRREVARRHAREPYDVVYQFSSIEALALPSSMRGKVPLVIQPETHMAGELKALISERRLGARCQPRRELAIVIAVRFVRSLVQRLRIRRASLLVCISSVFRDHLVHDYGFPMRRTTVIPNPVRLERFADVHRGLGDPPTILVLGRVAVRKGVEDVIAVARILQQRGIEARVRVIGGPDLSSDYTKLLEDLPPENSHYLGRIPPSQVPEELAQSDILLQASKYEPFGLTVAEALAAGVPVVATDEVGAAEQIDPAVAAVVAAGDVEGLVAAIVAMLERLRADAPQTRALARAEAERRYAPALVCREVSLALERLLDGA